MTKKQMRLKYNETGQLLTLTIHLDYASRKVFKYPENCLQCPVGYNMGEDTCGRNIPFTKEDYHHRPSTCKLQQVSLSELLKDCLVTKEAIR